MRRTAGTMTVMMVMIMMMMPITAMIDDDDDKNTMPVLHFAPSPSCATVCHCHCLCSTGQHCILHLPGLCSQHNLHTGVSPTPSVPLGGSPKAAKSA